MAALLAPHLARAQQAGQLAEQRASHQRAPRKHAPLMRPALTQPCSAQAMRGSSFEQTTRPGSNCGSMAGGIRMRHAAACMASAAAASPARTRLLGRVGAVADFLNRQQCVAVGAPPGCRGKRGTRGMAARHGKAPSMRGSKHCARVPQLPAVPPCLPIFLPMPTCVLAPELGHAVRQPPPLRICEAL